MSQWIVGYRFFREFPTKDGVIAAPAEGVGAPFELVEGTVGHRLETNPIPLSDPQPTQQELDDYVTAKVMLDIGATQLTKAPGDWEKYGNRRIYIDLANPDGTRTSFVRTFPSDAELAQSRAEAEAAGYFA